MLYPVLIVAGVVPGISKGFSHYIVRVLDIVIEVRTRGPPLSILVDVIRNHAESWLESLIPDLIPAIPC